MVAALQECDASIGVEEFSVNQLSVYPNPAKNTAFGKDFNFDKINTYGDFKKHVPLNDYEGLKPYVDRIRKGEKDILWPGKPTYFAKTSGTTSGAKYIPITKESMPNHIDSAKNTLLSYIEKSGNSAFVDGKMIFLQGSPVLSDKNGVKLGRLSGIAAHYVPSYLQSNRLPSWPVNCMEDWEMWIRIANNYPIATSNKVLAAYRSHQDNATNSTFMNGTALKTHQLICNLVDGYIEPNVKKNFSKIRNQKQAEFWLLSYKNSKHELSFKQKWSFVSKILKLDFSLKNSYRVFS